MHDRFFELPPELSGAKDLSRLEEIYPDIGFIVLNHFEYRFGTQEEVIEDGTKPVGIVLQIWLPTMPWFKITLPFHGLEPCKRFLAGFSEQLDKLASE